MRPPVCAVCGRRFDPFAAPARGGAVEFADSAPLPAGQVGHPAGTEWFCRCHVRAAQALRHRSRSDAIGRLRVRRWSRRGAGLGLALAALALPVWFNLHGAVDLVDVRKGYVGRIVEGTYRDHTIDREGARLTAAWLESRTRPTVNPLRILRQQLWYNASTDGHELEIWLEPATGESSARRFALYQSGETVFLRLEFDGKNRVLDAAFSAADLEEALRPHLFARGNDLPPEAPSTAPASRAPVDR